ncbi:MAG: DUF5723 family protein, partial [Saprospiraceae bacterium]|nr:DUF5723 family protein [Saprospiraceae bacterium]
HLHHKIGLFCLLFAFQLSAQQELMLQTLPDLWHATSINPALFPANKRIAIGLPAYSLDASHSGDITYNDLLRKAGDRNVIDFGQVIDKLEPENTLHFDQRIETFSFGLRLPGNWSIQAGHANRLTGLAVYPKSLAEVLWNGNGPYIDQKVDFGFQARVFDWNEWSVGLAKHFNKVSVGARLKYLTGVSSLITDRDHHEATIYTNPDIYQLQIETDYGFHSSSLISAIDTSGLGFKVDLADLKGQAFSKNTGVSVDLGVQVRVSEKLTLSASVLDWGGKIKWKENANYFRSKGSFTYEGVTFPGADIINGSDSLDFDQKLDTLNDIFQFQKTGQTFTTRLPERIYIGGTFQLTEKWGLGVSAFAQNSDNRRVGGLGASVRWLPVRWLSLGAMYSVNRRSAANLGFHVVVKPGPVQFYFLSDNLANAFSLKSSPAVNLRTGLSLVF